MVGAWPQFAAADARSDYLTSLLAESTSFRVRAQAALSLGRVEQPGVVSALSAALSDRHPAVRTAAASSLERLGDPSALPALRRARGERDAAARRVVLQAIRTLEAVARTRPRSAPVPPAGRGGSARYYVGVGEPGSTAAGVNPRIIASARSFLVNRIGAMDGMVVAPEGESRSAAERELRRRRLTGYFIDSSIVSVEPRDGGVRAAVSVILNTYPGRDMRAILSGAATVQGGGAGEEAQRQAVEGAIRGALRRLPQALAAADARSGR